MRLPPHDGASAPRAGDHRALGRSHDLALAEKRSAASIYRISIPSLDHTHRVRDGCSAAGEFGPSDAPAVLIQHHEGQCPRRRALVAQTLQRRPAELAATRCRIERAW